MKNRDLSTNFIEVIQGKEISKIWRGYGSAIFFELGELKNCSYKNNKPDHMEGEITIMIRWSWRIELARSIITGSWDDDKKWASVFKKIINSRIESFDFFGDIPEIVFKTTNKFRVLSFNTADGQPEWAIITKTPRIGTLSIKKGYFHVAK